MPSARVGFGFQFKFLAWVFTAIVNVGAREEFVFNSSVVIR